jgi:DNA-binding LacI/PurR family transcriptional regulator
MRKAKTNNLKHIAERLGLSVSTVSRVVNNKEYVKEDTRRRVMEALNECNYVPNEIARSLKSKTTHTIGVVLPDISEVFFGEIVKGINKIVSDEGYTVVIVDTNESKKNEQKYLEILYQKRIDALVLATVDLNGDSVKVFLDHSIPVIFIDNVPKLENINSVTINNRGASKLAIDFLIKNGHRDIATIIGSKEETTGSERMQGYIEALEAAGISVNENLIEYGNYKESSGYNCMCNLLSKRKENPFSAVYVTSEMMVFGAVKAIKENGLIIPDDISLIGFDVHDKTGLVRPSIATIRQPEKLIGKITGEMLLQELNSKENQGDSLDMPTRQVILEPHLFGGESVKKINN